MRFRSFFDVVRDAMDVVEMFSGVDTIDQMVSRLEVIKRREAEDALWNLTALRMSVESAMNDTMEMNGSLGDDDDGNDDFGDEDLKTLEEEPEEPKPASGKVEVGAKPEQNT